MSKSETVSTAERGIDRLHSIMTRLRDPQEGCPWDRVQTLDTLKPCVLEETYELLAAMDHPEDQENYVEELGDVLLQVMFQCVMAEQTGAFTFDEVANSIADKLIRRHPHVFGDVVAKNPEAVLKNWEQIKQREHAKSTRRSVLDGVPSVLPALLKAQRTQEKAARVGFDWKDAAGPLDKINEELAELKEAIAGSKDTGFDEQVKEELGDLIFAISNLARHLKVDAESALEGATVKFAHRFRGVETGAKNAGKSLRDMSLQEMEDLWEKVKTEEAKR